MDGWRLATYQAESGPRSGMIVGGTLADLANLTGQPAWADMLTLLEQWDTAQPALARAAEAIAAGTVAGGMALESVHLRAPLLRPGVIYCAGANYGDHVREMAAAHGGTPEPDPHTLGLKAWHFIKVSHAVTGPGAEVALPRRSKKVDWEAELAVVIGRRGSHVSQEQAMGLIAGYMAANDLSARDLGPRPGMPAGSIFSHDWIAHKSFDDSCPTGPWITPAQFIADPQHLPIQLLVNGVVKQDSNTAEMIFNIAEQIAHISEKTTLYPGDVILTGTPAGVGMGRGEFLQAGDVVTVRIAGLGDLTNKMV